MATEEASRPAPGHREEPRRVPIWVLAAIPLALIIAALALLLAVGGETLGDRPGPPVEELAVERTVLRPGEIELSVRNVGPDAVDVEQVFVNDMYVDFTETPEDVGRLGGQTLTLDYPLAGGLAAARDPADLHRRHDRARGRGRGRDAGPTPASTGSWPSSAPTSASYRWCSECSSSRFSHRCGSTGSASSWRSRSGSSGSWPSTPTSKGTRSPRKAAARSAAWSSSSSARGSPSSASSRSTATWPAGVRRPGEAGAGAFHLSLLVAIGIGLHNFGEGLAIGSAYAIGELALGAFLVFGFALHNTTEGLAIVAPLAKGADPRSSRWARWE